MLIPSTPMHAGAKGVAIPWDCWAWTCATVEIVGLLSLLLVVAPLLLLGSGSSSDSSRGVRIFREPTVRKDELPRCLDERITGVPSQEPINPETSPFPTNPPHPIPRSTHRSANPLLLSTECHHKEEEVVRKKKTTRSSDRSIDAMGQLIEERDMKKDRPIGGGSTCRRRAAPTYVALLALLLGSSGLSLENLLDNLALLNQESTDDAVCGCVWGGGGEGR